MSAHLLHPRCWQAFAASGRSAHLLRPRCWQALVVSMQDRRALLDELVRHSMIDVEYVDVHGKKFADADVQVPAAQDLKMADALLSPADWAEFMDGMSESQEMAEWIVSAGVLDYGRGDDAGYTFAATVVFFAEHDLFPLDAFAKMPVVYVCEELRVFVEALNDNMEILRRLLDIYAHHPEQEPAAKQDFITGLKRGLRTSYRVQRTANISCELDRFQEVL
jgi:hypothetical protein